MNNSIETFCGINLFEYEDWDELDVGHLCFYNVTWMLGSMKKFDGRAVSRKLEGSLEIDNDDGTKSFVIYVTDIPEVNNFIKSRIPEKIFEEFD